MATIIQQTDNSIWINKSDTRNKRLSFVTADISGGNKTPVAAIGIQITQPENPDAAVTYTMNLVMRDPEMTSGQLLALKNFGGMPIQATSAYSLASRDEKEFLDEKLGSRGLSFLTANSGFFGSNARKEIEGIVDNLHSSGVISADLQYAVKETLGQLPDYIARLPEAQTVASR